MWVNHALVAIFNVANMSFNAIREDKILVKNSELQYHILTFLCVALFWILFLWMPQVGLSLWHFLLIFSHFFVCVFFFLKKGLAPKL